MKPKPTKAHVGPKAKARAAGRSRGSSNKPGPLSFEGMVEIDVSAIPLLPSGSAKFPSRDANGQPIHPADTAEEFERFCREVARRGQLSCADVLRLLGGQLRLGENLDANLAVYSTGIRSSLSEEVDGRLLDTRSQADLLEIIDSSKLRLPCTNQQFLEWIERWPEFAVPAAYLEVCRSNADGATAQQVLRKLLSRMFAARPQWKREQMPGTKNDLIEILRALDPSLANRARATLVDDLRREGLRWRPGGKHRLYKGYIDLMNELTQPKK